MVVKNVDKLKELYEIDDYLWIEETVKLLKGRRFEELDLENLIEELEDLGSEKRHKVESLLQQIIRHLLLLDYWHSEYEINHRHWRSDIFNFRDQLNDRMTSNFYGYLEEKLAKIYRKARKYVQAKSGLDTFPRDCPYSLKQLLDEDWFPHQ